ncbi:MAG: hypothetical protein FWH29_02920 [Methanobrevibacter sp.]|nr:hypothetical protein [Methanobrevibacter sp.]
MFGLKKSKSIKKITICKKKNKMFQPLITKNELKELIIKSAIKAGHKNLEKDLTDFLNKNDSLMYEVNFFAPENKTFLRDINVNSSNHLYFSCIVEGGIAFIELGSKVSTEGLYDELLVFIEF